MPDMGEIITLSGQGVILIVDLDGEGSNSFSIASDRPGSLVGEIRPWLYIKEIAPTYSL